MRLFAIGDLHLPGGDNKPMDVFGPQWENHMDRIAADWRERVTDADTVLIPGDITWAMQLRDAVPDLRMIDALPGRKILCKGNHDYWWGSLTQLRAALPGSIRVLQHDAADAGELVVCGTRGWILPTPETPLGQEDQRIFNRELIRLELSLKQAEKLAAGRPLVAMLHYPPLYDLVRDTAFTAMLERYRVHTCVYGHLHGAGIRAGFTGEHNGVRYVLASCDALGFRLTELPMEAQTEVRPASENDTEKSEY